MKILLAHNQYQQPGGEDQSVAAEIAMLEAFGHQVIQYRVHNDAIRGMSRVGVAARTLWNRTSYAELSQIIADQRPDVAHFNNTFPLISPAAYYAARRAGVPVIQTLRNFRLLCPNAYLLRQQQICEQCLGRRLAWPSVVHACYRDDRAATAVVAGMLFTHRMLGTWHKAVDVYIALTEFGRQTFVRGGLPAEKIVVKPNFVYPDPGPGSGQGGYAIFVGRLSDEKGLQTLLQAWSILEGDVPLKIVGDGPLRPQVQAAAARDPRLTWLGQRSPGEVTQLMADAACLVFPSLWYEGLPRTIIEAYAVGTPVVGSQLGAMRELIVPQRTGQHFPPGDHQQLAAVVRDLWLAPERLQALRTGARQEFENKYRYQTNYEQLIAIYQSALAHGNRNPR